jgi:hypothetical protein
MSPKNAALKKGAGFEARADSADQLAGDRKSARIRPHRAAIQSNAAFRAGSAAGIAHRSYDGNAKKQWHIQRRRSAPVSTPPHYG